MDTAHTRQYLSQRALKVKPSGIRKFFDIAAAMPDVISLSVGEPDFTTPDHIRQAGIQSIERGETHYTSNWGTLELREAIAEELQRQIGVSYNPRTEIMVTVGVSEAVDDAMRALLDAGDEALTPDPGYVAYEADIVFSGGVPVPVPTYAEENYEPKAERFAELITPKTKLILLGSPNNPTGSVISREELEKIAALAVKHDLIVLSDEIYSRLVYGVEHVSIASLPGMRERTIVLNGFSKAYAMTGWRVGYAAGPANILEAMMKIHQYAIMCAPTNAQAAAAQALKFGEPDVQEMHAEFNRRRAMIVEGFRSIGFSCHEPTGAFYAFPSIESTGLDDETFTERLLREEQVAVVPGSAFGARGAGHIRCAYCAAYDKIEEAISRIGRFAARLKA